MIRILLLIVDLFAVTILGNLDPDSQRHWRESRVHLASRSSSRSATRPTIIFSESLLPPVISKKLVKFTFTVRDIVSPTLPGVIHLFIAISVLTELLIVLLNPVVCPPASGWPLSAHHIATNTSKQTKVRLLISLCLLFSRGKQLCRGMYENAFALRAMIM